MEYLRTNHKYFRTIGWFVFISVSLSSSNSKLSTRNTILTCVLFSCCASKCKTRRHSLCSRTTLTFLCWLEIAADKDYIDITCKKLPSFRSSKTRVAVATVTYNCSDTYFTVYWLWKVLFIRFNLHLCTITYLSTSTFICMKLDIVVIPLHKYFLQPNSHAVLWRQE
jgi:hypothetical protein